jgi:hypothetical protein
MTSTEPDARYLASQPVGAAASLNLDSFSFNYLNMDDNATLTVSLTLFRPLCDNYISIILVNGT